MTNVYTDNNLQFSLCDTSLNSTDNEMISVLSPLIKNNGAFVAGGCFKDLLNNKVPRDIDVYFRNENQFKEMKDWIGSSNQYTMLHISPNAVKFKHRTNNIIVDLIKKQFGTPAEIISEFDFTIVKFALSLDDNVFIKTYHNNFYVDLTHKSLDIQFAKPVDLTKNIDATFNRAIKYTRYGYNMTTNLKQILFNFIRRLPDDYEAKYIGREEDYID